MNLGEFLSNNRSAIAELPQEDQVFLTVVKILGIKWNTELDTLSISLKVANEKNISNYSFYFLTLWLDRTSNFSDNFFSKNFGRPN